MTTRQPDARPKNEPFDGVARTFTRALKAGDVHPHAFNIGTVLLCTRDWMTGEWIGTLADLLKLLGWPEARRDTLKRRLDDLRQHGWIDFDDPGQGRRDSWTISVGPIDFRKRGGSFAEVDPQLPQDEQPPAEVTSAGGCEQMAANPLAATELGASQLPQASPPRRRRLSRETELSLPTLSHGDSNGHDLEDGQAEREMEMPENFSAALVQLGRTMNPSGVSDPAFQPGQGVTALDMQALQARSLLESLTRRMG